MATQQQLADHLDMSQQQISDIMRRLGINWNVASIDDVRIAYIRHLRGVASDHETSNGDSLTAERVLTERVDRELKQMQLEEKKSVLINVDQLEPVLTNMVAVYRDELLTRDDKLKADLDALYGIDLDLQLLNEHTFAALGQLSKYAPEQAGGENLYGTKFLDR